MSHSSGLEPFRSLDRQLSTDQKTPKAPQENEKAYLIPRVYEKDWRNRSLGKYAGVKNKFGGSVRMIGCAARCMIMFVLLAFTLFPEKC